MGGDQGGSIRLPGSWCGLYGLKATFGLVPYTGIASLGEMSFQASFFPLIPIVITEATIDHTGPMTRTCLDNAILLKAIAGRDDLDTRTAGSPLPADVPDYPTFLVSLKGKDMPLTGFKVGLVKEGFENCEKGGLCDPRVGTAVKEAAGKWRELGAEVEEVSIPVRG